MNAFLVSLGAGEGGKTVTMSYLLEDDYGQVALAEEVTMTLQTIQTDGGDAADGDEAADDGEAADDESPPLWSSASTWKGLLWQEGDEPVVPAEGDKVVIPAGAQVLYDIGTSPVLDTLTVKGTLTFATSNTDAAIL